MADLEKALDLIEENFNEDEKYFGKFCGNSLLKKAQDELIIKFPKSYSFFVKKHGYGGINSLDIDGVTDFNFENSGTGGVVWNTINKRHNFALPTPLLPIMDIGNGDTYCLDTSQMNDEGECPVVVWPIGGYEQTPVLEVVAEDFGKFFLDMVKRQIEHKKSST